MTAQGTLLGSSPVSTVSTPALQRTLRSVLDDVARSGRPIFVIRHSRRIVVLMRVDLRTGPLPLPGSSSTPRRW